MSDYWHLIERVDRLARKVRNYRVAVKQATQRADMWQRIAEKGWAEKRVFQLERDELQREVYDLRRKLHQLNNSEEKKEVENGTHNAETV